MPQFRVEDDFGNTLTLEGDSPPTEQELEEIFSSKFSQPGNSPVATPERELTMGDFYTPPPAEVPSIFPKKDPRYEQLQKERIAIGVENEGQSLADYGAAAHTGLSLGQQMPATMVHSVADVARKLYGVTSKIPGIKQVTDIGLGVQEVVGKMVLPPGLQQAQKEAVEYITRPEIEDPYFKQLAEYEKWVHERDAMLGEPTFGTQLTESVARGFAELPAQMMGGELGAAQGQIAGQRFLSEVGGKVIGKKLAQQAGTEAAVKGSAIGAGVAGGSSTYAQEKGEGADTLTAIGRGGASGLVTALTTRAFGATGVESIFRNEGIKGIRNHLKRALEESGMEFAEESLDQIQQDLIERAQKNPGKSLGDTMHEVLLAGITGGILGGGVGSISGIAGEAKETYQRKAAMNEAGMPLIMPMKIEGGESDASKKQEAAAVHGDVQPQPGEGEGQVPKQEGQPGVQSQAQGRVLEPLSEDEQARHRDLSANYNALTDEENSELDELDARARADMVRRVTGEEPTGEIKGRTGEAISLIEQQIKEQGIDPSKVEIGRPKADEKGVIHSPYLGTHVKGSGRIRLNIHAIAEDMAKMPPSRRQDFVKSVITEEWFHSHTGRSDAKSFFDMASDIERAIGERIYLGKNERGDTISDENLGYEIMRRRIQRMKGMTITEVATQAGREKWTVQSLDILDNLIAKARRSIPVGKGAVQARAQLELLNKLEQNVKAARHALQVSDEDDEVGSARRDTPQTADELLSKPLGSHTPEQIESMPDETWADAMVRKKGEKWSVTVDATAWAMNQESSPELISDLEAKAKADMEQAMAKGDFPMKMQWYLDAAHVLKNDEVGQGNVDTVKRMAEQGRVELAKAEPVISPVEEVEAKRRGLTKAAERRIELNKKYMEAMGRKPVEPTQPKVPQVAVSKKVPRKERVHLSEFFAKPTPESIDQEAQNVLSDELKLPSFKRFMDFVRSKHGDIQPGQVTEAWVDNVNKFLEAATGEQLNKLVDRLGLRRQVFGIIPQGSKGFGLTGPPPTLERTGEIADPVEVETGRTMIQKALERAERLSKKADKLEEEAKGTKSVEETKMLEQKAEILRRTAAGIEAGAAKGEGIELRQDTLFPGIEERTSQLTGKPVPVPGKPGATKFVSKPSTIEPIITKGLQLRARDRAIAILGAKLKQQGQPLDDQLSRKTIGPEDIRWHEDGADIIVVNPEDLQDLEELGLRLTAKAGSDATTKKIRGGGRFVIREKSMPRSNTKRVITLKDKKTGVIYMVDGYRDSKRGPVFLDPHSVTGEHRTLEQMASRLEPTRSYPLDKPVKDFFWKFNNQDEFYNKFGKAVSEMAKEVGYSGFEGDVPLEEALKHIEGSEAVEGEGGFVQGPHATITRATLGMVDGARDLGWDITDAEARQLFREFRFMEAGEDAETRLENLKNRANRGILRPKDHVLITAIGKVYESMSTPENPASPEDVLNEIYALTQRIEKESAFAKQVPPKFAQQLRIPAKAAPAEQAAPTGKELTMPLNRVPPTLVRPEQLPSYAPKIERKAAPPADVVGGGLPVRLKTPKTTQRELYRLRERAMRIEAGKPKPEVEMSPMAETPGPREAPGPQRVKPIKFTPEELESWRETQGKVNLTSNKLVTDVAKAVAESELPLSGTAAEAAPLDLPRETKSETDQGELFAKRREPRRDIGSYNLRRISQEPTFWNTERWKNTQEYLVRELKQISAQMNKSTPDELAGLRQKLNGLNLTIRRIISDSGLQMDETGTPLWETVKSDLFNQASYFMEALEMSESIDRHFPDAGQNAMDELNKETRKPDDEVGALRRTPPRTVAESVRNLIDDTGSVYERWMVERIAEYGGRWSKKFAAEVRQMMSREKQLYGGLTPLIDRARRLAGGIDPGRALGGTLGEKVREIPGRVKGTLDAMKAGIWFNRLKPVTQYTAIANLVGAMEGTIPIPLFAVQATEAMQAANMEIGKRMEQVTESFIATGLYQRNITSLGYDIIRSGGGVLWNRWTAGIARANALSGATEFSVRQHFKDLKSRLDKKDLTSSDLEKVNQDMARQYPEAVTHVKHLRAWRPIMHADAFNYIENAARRATHVIAFREIYPNTDEGKAELSAMMNSVRDELEPRVQDDLDDLLRALHGHPTDDFNTKWGRRTGMTPQQLFGATFKGLNQTIGNLAAKAVLSGQIFVQPGEIVTGSTPVFLGYDNYLKALSQLRGGELYGQLELTGSVNRVMGDYILNPHALFRSGFKVTGNVVAKVSMQNFMNEIQEAAAAATARIVSENIITGNLSEWEKRMLPQTFKMMGFSKSDVTQMMAGDTELLGQFQRKAAAWLTGGNKAVAEGSGLSTSRLFGSMLRFQTYPMVKGNQFRRLAVNWWDTARTGNGRDIWDASRLMVRFVTGNVMQGTITSALVTLAYAGLTGFKIKWEEVKDEPFWFAGESFMASMSGPLYLLWRGARQNGITGVGEQASRVVFPWAITQDLWDMTQGQGAYRDTDVNQKIGRFLSNRTPMTKAIGTGMAMAGLGNHSQPLDVSITALHRWQRDTFPDMRGNPQFNAPDERKVFRTHVRNAIEAMKNGNREKFVDEWMLAAEAKSQDSVDDSLRARKVLVGPGGRKLTIEEKEALEKRIGFDAYERLEHFDLMIDSVADGIIPLMDRIK